MTRSHTLRRWTAAAIVFTALLGACGSDDAGMADGKRTSTADAGDERAGGDKDADKKDGGAAAPTEGDAVSIEDFNYLPPNLKAAAGTEVTFTNNDSFAHTVTAKDESFDSDNMDKDDVFTHTFAEPGTYEYFCRIHVYMTGTVTVA